MLFRSGNDSPDDSRGRNPELIRERNLHLLYRFYYYRQDNRNSYEWMVAKLAKEFYLTRSTVGQLIAASTKELLQIRNEKATVSDLRKKYPYWVW